MTIERLDAYTYQVIGKVWDCHIRQEGEKWMVDVFEKAIADKDKAHQMTEECETLNEALDFAFEWEGEEKK